MFLWLLKIVFSKQVDMVQTTICRSLKLGNGGFRKWLQCFLPFSPHCAHLLLLYQICLNWQGQSKWKVSHLHIDTDIITCIVKWTHKSLFYSVASLEYYKMGSKNCTVYLNFFCCWQLFSFLEDTPCSFKVFIELYLVLLKLVKKYIVKLRFFFFSGNCSFCFRGNNLILFILYFSKLFFCFGRGIP